MQKIIIENFRQIKYAEIEIKNFLFLIGEQASGKSTIAKLIYFFKSLKRDYSDLIYSKSSASEKVIEADLIKIIQDKFKQYFGYTSDLNPSFKITFYYSTNSNKYLILSSSGSLKVTFNPAFFNHLVAQTKNIAASIIAFETTEKQTYAATMGIAQERARLIEELIARINDVFNDTRTPMFFPAGRNITVSYPEQFQALFIGKLSPEYESKAKSIDVLLMKDFFLYSKYLIDYFQKNNFENLSSNSEFNKNSLLFALQKYEQILKGKYKNIGGIEKLQFGGGKREAIPLNLASSGQQEAIRIIQDIFYVLGENQKAFRVIEEPEAHLYPKAQKNLIEMLSLMTNVTKSQLIITTHSPHVLSIFNNLLYYSKHLNEKPQHKALIEKHFETVGLESSLNEKINVDFDNIQAYALSTTGEEYCQSILDAETKLIGNNFLDAETEKLNEDFDFLYDLLFQA